MKNEETFIVHKNVAMNVFYLKNLSGRDVWRGFDYVCSGTEA